MLMIEDGHWIGGLNDDFFVGRRLSQVLSFGVRTPPLKLPGAIGSLEEVPDFWANYVDRGLCAVDPMHEAVFEHDRWALDGNTRICRWCGHQQRLEARTKTIVVQEWVDLEISNYTQGSHRWK
jgi:hypothetical protein